MDDKPVIHIHCPGCEAVRELSPTPCPDCRRCAYCGRYFKNEDPLCTCVSTGNLDRTDGILTKFIIPEERVAHERRRMEIRKELEPRKTIADTLIAGMMVSSAGLYNVFYRDAGWIGFTAYWLCVIAIFLLLRFLVDRSFQKVVDRRLQTFEASPTDILQPTESG